MPATVTPAYGVRGDGSFGVAHYRAFCPDCGHLGARLAYSGARSQVTAHNRQCDGAARDLARDPDGARERKVAA